MKSSNSLDFRPHKMWVQIEIEIFIRFLNFKIHFKKMSNSKWKFNWTAYVEPFIPSFYLCENILISCYRGGRCENVFVPENTLATGYHQQINTRNKRTHKRIYPSHKWMIVCARVCIGIVLLYILIRHTFAHNQMHFNLRHVEYAYISP